MANMVAACEKPVSVYVPIVFLYDNSRICISNNRKTPCYWCIVGIAINRMSNPQSSKNRLAAPPSAAALPAVTSRQYSRPKTFYFYLF